MSQFTQIALSNGKFLSIEYDYYPEIYTPCDEPDEPESIEIPANGITELTMGDETAIDQDDISEIDMTLIVSHCINDYKSGCF